VIEILSSRREYTKLNPFVVLLGKGDHQITSSSTDEDGDEVATTLTITCSNITFVGTGKDTTTILGGFLIQNLENITFKQMTVTNTSQIGGDGYGGDGIMMSNAKVELIDVALKGCDGIALEIPPSTSETTTVVATRCEFANSNNGAAVFGSLASATFNNCVFHDNEYDGIFVSDEATIHLHGEATAAHSNKRYGIAAYDSAKVIIHLTSHHNTSYNNTRGDRYTYSGGAITNAED